MSFSAILPCIEYRGLPSHRKIRAVAHRSNLSARMSGFSAAPPLSPASRARFHAKTSSRALRGNRVAMPFVRTGTSRAGREQLRGCCCQVCLGSCARTGRRSSRGEQYLSQVDDFVRRSCADPRDQPGLRRFTHRKPTDFLRPRRFLLPRRSCRLVLRKQRHQRRHCDSCYPRQHEAMDRTHARRLARSARSPRVGHPCHTEAGGWPTGRSGRGQRGPAEACPNHGPRGLRRRQPRVGVGFWRGDPRLLSRG